MKWHKDSEGFKHSGYISSAFESSCHFKETQTENHRCVLWVRISVEACPAFQWAKRVQGQEVLIMTSEDPQTDAHLLYIFSWSKI